MTDIQEVLVKVLAEGDALRLPIRSTSPKMRQNAYWHGRNLDTVGVPFRGGGSQNDRKSAERLLARVAKTGLAVVDKPRGAKFANVKLTSEGDAQTRSLCGLPGREIARDLLACVAAATRRDAKTHSEKWMAETVLCGSEDPNSPENRRWLAFTEQVFCLAHSLGWLECGSTICGHVRYSVTAAGWAELDSPSKPPKFKALAMDRDAVKVYRQFQDTVLARLETAPPEMPSEIGLLPLPVASEGVPLNCT